MTYRALLRRIRGYAARALLLTSLSMGAVIVAVSAASGQAFTVTEQNIRSAILNPSQFTQDQINQMDLNGDNRIDVADLVKLLKTTTPVTDFAIEASTVTEGDGTISVRVVFSTSFSGTLRYTVGGTAVPGTDYQVLSGTITADGLYVDIPVTLLDDNLISEAAKTIVLDLYYDAEGGFGYVPGSSTEHTVYVLDNDAVWDGMIDNNGASLQFQMQIIQTPTGATATMLGDGYGIIPSPAKAAEGWPATGVTLTNSAFAAVVGPIPISKDSTLTNVDLQRHYQFNADASMTGQTVDAGSQITGTLTETVISVVSPQFNREFQNGTFTLLKRIPYIKPKDPTMTEVTSKARTN